MRLVFCIGLTSHSLCVPALRPAFLGSNMFAVLTQHDRFSHKQTKKMLIMNIY